MAKRNTDNKAKRRAQIRLQVKEVAAQTGVSIRTLHYYHQIGLLVPGDQTKAGYRLYSQDDLVRLHHILVARALGMPLKDIMRLLDDPDYDYATALRAHRAALIEKQEALAGIINGIDELLASLDQPDDALDLAKIFGGFDPQAYEAEAEKKWGNTDAYAQSARRTKSYGKDEWAKIHEQQTEIWQEAGVLFAQGATPDSAAALDIADQHRRYIDRWFYDLDMQGHVSLAQMWLGDARFVDAIDAYGTGLTDWLARAIEARAQSRGQAGA